VPGSINRIADATARPLTAPPRLTPRRPANICDRLAPLTQPTVTIALTEFERSLLIETLQARACHAAEYDGQIALAAFLLRRADALREAGR
jgi:hypothetical protein